MFQNLNVFKKIRERRETKLTELSQVLTEQLGGSEEEWRKDMADLESWEISAFLRTLYEDDPSKAEGKLAKFWREWILASP